MKHDQLTKYKKINIFLQTHAENDAGSLVTEQNFENKKSFYGEIKSILHHFLKGFQ